MPIEIRITGEPEELAQLLRSWGPGQSSSLRDALELAIANAAAPAESAAKGPETAQAPAPVAPMPFDGPPMKVPAKPPREWRFADLRDVLLKLAMDAPTEMAQKTLAAMGVGRLSELPQARYGEYIEALGDRWPPLRAALDQARRARLKA